MPSPDAVFVHPGRLWPFLICLSLGSSACFAQCPPSLAFQEKLLAIESDGDMSLARKIDSLSLLQKKYLACHPAPDSVYARILHRIGLYQYLQNGNVASLQSIDNTLQAFHLNLNNPLTGSRLFALNSCSNLGYYYKSIGLLNLALTYFDSCIMLTYQWQMPQHFKNLSRFQKCLIYSAKGDYQKIIGESTLGISETGKEDDTAFLAKFYNRRAEAQIYLNAVQEANRDVDSALKYIELIHDSLEKTNSLKFLAQINDLEGKYDEAARLYRLVIRQRIAAGKADQVADDYIDFGNFFLAQRRYQEASACYTEVARYARKINDAERLAKAEVSLGETSFEKGDQKNAAKYYARALTALLPGTEENIFANLSTKDLESIANKDLLLTLLINRTGYFLKEYKRSSKNEILRFALHNSMVNDSVLTHIRHEQLEERSKLYWRKYTRSFYGQALEACWLANNAELAFYFMEKSRAVLLNDKLNELGAAMKLPPAAAAREQELQLNILNAQQKLAMLPANSAAYNEVQISLLEKKNDFEKYTKGLEQDYPLYFQYKYAEDFPTLQRLQGWLGKNNKAFVHYYMEDTLAFALAITAKQVNMIRISPAECSHKHINSFLNYCADEQKLNRSYREFMALSGKLYHALFEPLHLPRGKIIICPDQFLLPFEAFSRNEHYLIDEFTFSYVYSAGFLLKKINGGRPQANYIGFAPVRFRSGLGLTELDNSASALKESGEFFSDKSLYIEEKASKRNFLDRIGNYAMAMVFSHARADTSDSEPQLFMQDSVIALSELELLNNPATRLVVLSACQTQVGRNESGEGIYSLSRGFAAAGIPSVAATLWQANDQSIYQLSRSFSKYLAAGMSMDEALTRAKLDFIHAADKSKTLPYYWANLILIGNADPLPITTNHLLSSWWTGLLLAAILIISFLAFFLLGKGKKPSAAVH